MVDAQISTYLQTPLLSVSLIWLVKWSRRAALTVLYHRITSAILLSSEWIFDLQWRIHQTHTHIHFNFIRLACTV